MHVYSPPAETAMAARPPPPPPPLAVNCCVWPVEMLGLLGVTVRAGAGSTDPTRQSHRAHSPAARTFSVVTHRCCMVALQLFIEDLAPRTFTTSLRRRSRRR